MMCSVCLGVCCTYCPHTEQWCALSGWVCVVLTFHILNNDVLCQAGCVLYLLSTNWTMMCSVRLLGVCCTYCPHTEQWCALSGWVCVVLTVHILNNDVLCQAGCVLYLLSTYWTMMCSVRLGVCCTYCPHTEQWCALSGWVCVVLTVHILNNDVLCLAGCVLYLLSTNWTIMCSVRLGVCCTYCPHTEQWCALSGLIALHFSQKRIPENQKR